MLLINFRANKFTLEPLVAADQNAFNTNEIRHTYLFLL